MARLSEDKNYDPRKRYWYQLGEEKGGLPVNTEHYGETMSNSLIIVM
ncbi:MAG: hypothetical protein KAX49_20800 [Halanaerobiales bacterium]|nr:hypothetical protein [Halanaerobiales bacterium]